eukprot:GHRR01026654.1.p1 GENE.GHRR01026654.1~~GHRR01026654.1.p1  ORF type:complete len:120 (+),score=28.60 GHRR01026654.1:522-881(+)
MMVAYQCEQQPCNKPTAMTNNGPTVTPLAVLLYAIATLLVADHLLLLDPTMRQDNPRYCKDVSAESAANATAQHSCPSEAKVIICSNCTPAADLQGYTRFSANAAKALLNRTGPLKCIE